MEARLIKIRETAVKMTVSQLKSECVTLSEKMSKIKKADRVEGNYSLFMAAWKIMRIEITRKQELANAN